MRTLLFQTGGESQSWIERTLGARGHHVDRFDEAEAAWEAYAANDYALVVLAGAFEVGLALCRRIRAAEADETTTVVAVLEDEQVASALLQAVLDAGADDYVLASLGPERMNARLAFIERNAHVKAQRAMAEAELVARARQQAVVAELGRRALAGDDLQTFMTFAVRATAEALGATHCKVLERVDAHTLVLRAAYGWPDALVGRATVDTHAGSQAGYTLHSTFPVVVEDLRHETRFPGTALLRDHGIASGISIVIDGDGEAYGVLSAHTTEPRTFRRHDISFLQSVANTLADAINRKRAEDALRESEARNRAILETTVDAIITSDTDGRILSFNRAAEQIFGYAAGEVIGQNLKVLMPSPYHEEHDGYIRSYHETGRRKIIGIGREVTGQRKDGTTFPMDLAVSEVCLGDRVIFTGIIRDITERRRLEQEILQISDQERRRIGQDLHDGLGQMLTGTGLICQNLARKLKAQGLPAADEVAEITDLIREADQFARALARGLVPVELEANGLTSALQRLATNAERLFGIECHFEEVGAVPLHDGAAAIHLYRIAQEALSNAVKHGRARRVHVTLAQGEDLVRLHVQDDGVGIPDELPKERGMGVRIMHYRARIIGATLEMWRDPAGGTVVTCTLPRHHRPGARQTARAGRKTKQAQTP